MKTFNTLLLENQLDFYPNKIIPYDTAYNIQLYLSSRFNGIIIQDSTPFIILQNFFSKFDYDLKLGDYNELFQKVVDAANSQTSREVICRSIIHLSGDGGGVLNYILNMKFNQLSNDNFLLHVMLEPNTQTPNC
jgi:hypothetical protein